VRFDPLTKRAPATLIGTLRRAEPARMRRWHLLAFLAGLLGLRALFYWQIGATLSPVWAGKINLRVIVLSFPCHDNYAGLGRMLLFSCFSFGLALGIFYLWLFLLSLLRGPDPIQRLVRVPLGRVDGWPRGLKLFLPLAVTALLWVLASGLFVWLGIIPPPLAMSHRLAAALIIGLGSYLVWKFPVGAVLILHLLNTYIYFGKHPIWNYVNATAQNILATLKIILLPLFATVLLLWLTSWLLFWLQLVILLVVGLGCCLVWKYANAPARKFLALPEKIPLRIGKADFAPVVGIALVFLLAEAAGRGLVFLYAKMSP
jgi:hypothetical protein